MEHTWELNHVVVAELEHSILPLLWGNWVVLFLFRSLLFLLLVIVSATVFRTAKVLRGALSVLLDQSLVLGSTCRVIESTCEQFESVLFELESLSLFIKRLVFLLIDKLCFASLLEFLEIHGLLVLFVETILFARVALSHYVGGEVFLLELFPPVSVELNGSQGEILLVFCELAILSACVHAHHELNLLLDVGCCLN